MYVSRDRGNAQFYKCNHLKSEINSWIMEIQRGGKGSKSVDFAVELKVSDEFRPDTVNICTLNVAHHLSVESLGAILRVGREFEFMERKRERNVIRRDSTAISGGRPKMVLTKRVRSVSQSILAPALAPVTPIIMHMHFSDPIACPSHAPCVFLSSPHMKFLLAPAAMVSILLLRATPGPSIWT